MCLFVGYSYAETFAGYSLMSSDSTAVMLGILILWTLVSLMEEDFCSFGFQFQNRRFSGHNSTILDKNMCLSHSLDHLQDLPWRAAAVRRWCDSLLRFRGPPGPKSKNVHRALPGRPRNLQALLRLRSGGSVRHRSGHLNIFFNCLEWISWFSALPCSVSELTFCYRITFWSARW